MLGSSAKFELPISIRFVLLIVLVPFSDIYIPIDLSPSNFISPVFTPIELLFPSKYKPIALKSILSILPEFEILFPSLLYKNLY